MANFIQLHVLTNYPPSNLNRDDTGRPKTALMGNASRLRISSQSQKRAWRTSDIFEAALAGNLGKRTKRMGNEVFDILKKGGIDDKKATEWTRSIVSQFGKVKGEGLEIEQLAHFGPEEIAAIEALAEKCAKNKAAPSDEELNLLRKPRKAVDIAMFGRMLADKPAFNVEAAIQVSHAITVHKAAVEDDYFSAVDDLNKGLEDKGAAHIGERGYGAGLYYLYVCVDHDLLLENLGGDSGLVNKALAAFINAMTKVSPTGMQNSFASRAYASYVLAEKGNQQPRSLVQAFLKPVQPRQEQDMFEIAVKSLMKRRDNFDKVYGPCADKDYVMNAEEGEGTLEDLIKFVQE